MRDDLISYTKRLVDGQGRLTYSFTPGDILPSFKRKIKESIRYIDSRLGLDFKKVKYSRSSDIIIGYGDLPQGSNGAAVWTDIRWEIRFPVRYYGDYIFRHEMGHVLGFDHVPMGSKSLMAPGWNGYTTFTRSDWRQLEAVWGTEV